MTHFAGDAVLAMAQGGCYRCRRGSELIDFDCFIEGEGSLALCRNCVGEGAEAAGLLFNAAVVAELETQLAEARAIARDAQAREAAFKSALDAATAFALEPESPATEHVVASDTDRCSATKKNGERCKGQATTDHGTCNFHS